MRRFRSYNDLQGQSAGPSSPRAARTDLHFDTETPTRLSPPIATVSAQQGIPGRWPSSPPPQETSFSSRAQPQWDGPSRPLSTSPPIVQWDDFLDMPEPVLPPISSPERVPPRHDSEPFRWVGGNDPRRRNDAYASSQTYGPLDTLPTSLSASLPPSAPPPPLPPKTPIPQVGAAPPLPQRNYPPYNGSAHRYSNSVTSVPERVSSSHLSVQVDDAYYPPRRQTPQNRPVSAGHQLSPDLHYASNPQVPPSHPSFASDTTFFAPPSQSQYSYSDAHTPLRPGEHTPPSQNQYSYSDAHTPPRPGEHTPPKAPFQHQIPVPRPSPPSQQSSSQQQLPISPYIRPASAQHTPSPPRRPSPQPSPPRPVWRPSPPPRKPALGPITSIPPANSLTTLRHLPYSPILQPAYHRETIDHPQHFAKNNHVKIMVIPAESTTFLAGNEIYGRMEVNCKGDGGSKGKSEILIGEIGIELIAYDESKAEGCPPRAHLFLLARRKFQLPFDKSAPLDKLTPAIAFPTTVQPDDAGYRQPAKATVMFPFRFALPNDCGTAIECGTGIRTRYTLTGYAKVRIQGSFETIIHSMEVDVVEQLPFDHIYRNPGFEEKKLEVKGSTEKSFRGKSLTVDASIPKQWFKAGETVPVTLILTPDGYKKIGWIKATLINRVSIKAKQGEGKGHVFDYSVLDERIDDDTDFDSEKPSTQRILGLKIPKTCRSVSTAFFDVNPYIKVQLQYNAINTPLNISLPSFDIIHPTSLETESDDGERFANLTGTYIVREIDMRGNIGKIIRERPGTNSLVGWDWYVSKEGRGKILQ